MGPLEHNGFVVGAKLDAGLRVAGWREVEDAAEDDLRVWRSEEVEGLLEECELRFGLDVVVDHSGGLAQLVQVVGLQVFDDLVEQMRAALEHLEGVVIR